MKMLFVLFMLPVLGASPSNLVGNPRFEEVEGTLPARWHAFVMPQDGAYARLDDREAHVGEYSLVLHTPEEYDREPVNNWSQNIIADVGGKEVVVRGYIKTRDVTEAALWIQCFSAYPRRLVKFATTSDEMPLYGDNDWTPVEMRVEVPERVNLLVLRCVIKGRGSAWFDDLSVTVAQEPPGVAEEEPMVSASDEGPMPPLPDAPLAPATQPRWNDAYESIDDPVVESYRMMVDTYWELWDENANLVEELFTLRRQMVEMREALAELEALAPVTPQEEPASPTPPLVPRRRVDAEEPPL